MADDFGGIPEPDGADASAYVRRVANYLLGRAANLDERRRATIDTVAMDVANHTGDLRDLADRVAELESENEKRRTEITAWMIRTFAGVISLLIAVVLALLGLYLTGLAKVPGT